MSEEKLEPTVPEGELSPEAAMSFMQKSMAIGVKLGGYLGAIFVAIMQVSMLGVYLAKLVTTLTEYFQDKKKREKEAYDEAQAAKLRAIEDMRRRENDRAKSEISAMDAAWKARYDKVLAYIKGDQLFEAMQMFSNKKDEISQVIYDSTRSPEYRAIEAIRIQKG